MRRRTGAIIAVTLAFALCIIGLTGVSSKASPEKDTIDILFTADIHSYLDSYQTVEDGKEINVGGMPRLSTLIKQKKEINPDTLVFDGGDYAMGTLYQTLFSTNALEYRVLSKLQYDAITFGNHEFDYGTEELVSQYKACKDNCNYYPAFCVCNIDWSSSDDRTQKVYSVMKDINLCEYTIIERNGMKIGVTGVLGEEAVKDAPTLELKVLDPIESVRKTVDKMIANDHPDMIVCISHSGGNPAASEDVEVVRMAKAVPEIDFVLLGHPHIVLNECVKVGDTYIGEVGCYGRNTGFISLKKNERGRFDLIKYEMISMDDSIKEDPEILSMLSEFKGDIDEKFLSHYGYTSEEVVATNNVEFATVDDLYDIHTEHNLGDFLSDSYRWATGQHDTGDDTPISIAVAPAGTIRGTYLPGDISVAKVYESFSLGSGMDGTVGYPIIDLYLTGTELKTMCELDASVSDLMNSARLYMSGIEFTYNPHRMILNRVTEAHLNTGILDDDTDVAIEDDKLYRVVTDLYSGRMLGSVSDLSYGLLSIVPKDKNGVPYEKIEDAIAHDINTGEEIKTWICIAEYMKSYDSDGDKTGEIPQYYVNHHDRKVIDDSWNIINLVKNPNKFFFMIIGIIILVLVIVFFVIKLLVWIMKKIISGFNKTNKKTDL